MNQLRKCPVVEQAEVVIDTEGSNEVIVIGEMMDTPPGSQATACCSRDCAGTWEDLCFPSVLGEIVVSGRAGLRGPR